jgi:hypothetical protein
MTALFCLDSQYDTFLFASLSETDEMTLSVLSLLARQDVDPWQEAARLTQLPKTQAINSLAAKIWTSNSERWSPSEASILAARLIELLPSHSHSSPRWASDDTGRSMFWIVAWILCMSVAISGNNLQKPTSVASAPATGVSIVAQEHAATRTPRGIGTD